MDIMKFVQSDLVQIAVAISGLLTLVLLLVQGWKAWGVPLVQRIRLGFKAAREREAAAFQESVRKALERSPYLEAHMALLSVQVHLALGTLVIATCALIFAVLLFVPGVAERGGWYVMMFDMQPQTYVVISTVMMTLAMAILLNAVLGVRRFSRALMRAENPK